MNTVLPAVALAGIGFLFYKIISWYTNAPQFVAIVATVIVMFIIFLVAEGVGQAKSGKEGE